MSKLISNFLFRRLFDALSINGPKLNVLIYHRVLAKPDPLRPWEIDAVGFEQHLRWISEVFNVIPLKDAVQALQKKQLPRRSLCITFDDGYLDNAEVALPLLKTYKMPATFFCTSAFIEGGMMWNDQVIEAIRHWPKNSISVPRLGITDLPLSSPSIRAVSAEKILNKLKYIEKNKRSNIAQQLLTKSQHEPAQQMMSAEQIHMLHKQQMEIGGHTHNHPILANLDKQSAVEEIQHNKRILEDIIGEKITSFAYPNGKPGKDFLPEHSEIISEAGYKIALSTSPGVSTSNMNQLQLPRFTPWDKTKEKFLLRLALNHSKEVSFT